jgi:hypothetical protein
MLRRFGLPSGHPAALEGCALLVDRGASRDGGIDLSTGLNRSETCITGFVLALVSEFGFRSPMEKAESRAREFFLRHHLYRSHRTGEVVKPEFTRFSFPPRWHHDVLRTLDYFRASDAEYDPRLEDPIDLLRRKRGKDGRWRLQNRHPGKVFFEMEKVGKPSRWNTLRALRVLKWWDGSTKVSGERASDANERADCRPSRMKSVRHISTAVLTALEVVMRKRIGTVVPSLPRIRRSFFSMVLFGVLLCLPLSSPAHLEMQGSTGLRGDPAAIADAEKMVEAMGGLAIWRELESVHFVHEWDIFDRPDIYLENEILDLTGPRSYVTMESEIYNRVRAYSPEHRYWNIVNEEFSYASDQAYENAMERAPYSIYRLARAIARGDSHYHVQFGPMRDLSGTTGLEFRGPDDEVHGWILLNTRMEPVVWATTQYSYSFGPLQRYGNLRVPKWAITGGGRVRYEMVSLTGSNQRPDLSLFAPPPDYRER